jgi:glutamate--cysteine ligase
MPGPAESVASDVLGHRRHGWGNLMASSRSDAARATTRQASPGTASTTAAGIAVAGEPDADPLTESDAEEQIHGICFKTGPPSRIGVELEWLVRDGRDPALPVDQQRVASALAGLGAPGALPGHGRLTTEPGGQIELSSAPAVGLGGCVATARHDLTAITEAIRPVGLSLAGEGLDPYRSPRRVLDLPRYAAMEEFFNRAGPWGRLMMCSTASVQVCLDAGEEGSGPASFGWRWRLLHAIGPVLVAAFANSPLSRGRPTGWKSTRQAIWFRLDPSRTRPPACAEPGTERGGQATDPRTAWMEYALAAQVMCVRRSDTRSWCAPAGLTFRDWLRGAGERPATRGDLLYHLSTLFPPVRPRGHLELRVIDAQPGDGWIVPAAVVTALLDDTAAAEQAMAAAEVLWCETGHDGNSPWQRAARRGLEDPAIATAGVRCFEAAGAALGRLGAPAHIRRAVADFTERYVVRGRCPADDRLDGAGRDPRPPRQRIPTHPPGGMND